jgi:putative hydrolase of the HAD superfamily
MSKVKAVVFDFIGTLTNVRGYSLEDSKMKLYKAIVESGFNITVEDFFRAYDESHEKYRVIRYHDLLEVTNAIWISEALNSLGFKTTPEDAKIKTAVNIFFQDYVESLELRPCAEQLLSKAAVNRKLGLVSNFTFAPVIYAGLRKLGISHFFSAILVSEAFGFRKPHAKMFQEILRRLNVKADEAVYVGDSPLEDIRGAKEAGMRTVFVPSQFYSLDDLYESKQATDFVVGDLQELLQKLGKIVR